ncbi:adenosylmethionine--8-amino-7-oxononanoate transaminase [Megalodesulfovibrio paquesii]
MGRSMPECAPESASNRLPPMLCITGTDTDAGKTLVTAALARAATAAGKTTGKAVLVIKPVQTGCTKDSAGQLQAPDVYVCREAAPEAGACALVLLEPACSPHLAARSAGLRLSPGELAIRVRQTVLAGEADLVLIEGAGGLMTPLNEKDVLADLFAELDCPLLLVVGNRLGAVNHALLTIEAARARGLCLAGFVTTEPTAAVDDAERALRQDNLACIERLGGLPRLAAIPYLEGMAGTGAQRVAAWAQAARAVEPVLEALGKQGPQHAGRDSAETLLAFDRAHLWHPYTSALNPQRTWQAIRTRGTRITLRDGRELVDGMASWWCAIHGYNHPALLTALRHQAAQMPHVMFGGLTHEPAVALGQALLGAVPPGLEHVFLADSGSVSVEVAVKMALQYQTALGRPGKTRLLALRGGYHGDTLGAMSVCDPETGMHHLFRNVLPAQLFAPRPACRFDGPYDPAPFHAFAALLEEHAATLAAVILEPIVQGAGGMWFYHPTYLRQVREACDRHGCLLIADEIATGFGRTGRLFACEHAGITPDILCVGKGLTGGVLSLAATLTTRTVAEGISHRSGVLMHGPTYMANPLACAVACASLALLADGAWAAEVARLEAGLRQGLLPCASLPGVRDVRVLGAIGVLEMDTPVNTTALQAFFVQKGVWIRPFGRLIYVMPPYVSTDEDITLLTRAMREAVEEGAWR